MNKELIDRVWKYYLLKEFKEEVKAEYHRTSIMGVKGQYELGILHTYENTFGYHNLTSDAEGEEILCVSRKRVQEMYSVFEKFKDKDDTCFNLATLFGSKCLPDELNEDNFASKEPRIEDGEKESFTYPKFRTGDKVLFNNNICRIIGADREDAEYQLERIIDNHPMGWAEENEISLYEEPKPAEPKFKRGDMVIYKWTGKKKVVVGMDKYGRYMIALPNMQSPMHANESDLEPYTEPKEDLIPSNSGELKSQDVDKHFDNILKDSFSKERRLNIAKDFVAVLLSRLNYDPFTAHHCCCSGGEAVNPYTNIARIALSVADALIYESQLTDKK